MTKPGGSGDYYFNLETREVEQGRRSPWTRRMGPYATREEAEKALEAAAARTEEWDREDERDADWGAERDHQ